MIKLFTINADQSKVRPAQEKNVDLNEQELARISGACYSECYRHYCHHHHRYDCYCDCYYYECDSYYDDSYCY